INSNLMKKSFIILLFLFLTVSAGAQFITSLNITQPPAALSEWISNNAVVTYLVNNPDIPRNVIIKAEIKTLAGDLVATKDLSKAQVYTIQKEVRIFHGKEVMPLETMIFAPAYINTLEKTGKLPAGTYILEVRLVSPLDFLPLSTLQARTFNLAAIQLPILLLPVENAELDAKVTAKILALYANKTPDQFMPKDFALLKDVNKNLGMMETVSKMSLITGRGNMNGTKASDLNKLFADQKALVENLKKDPFVQMYGTFKSSYLATTDAKVNALQTDIDALQKQFMAQQMETDKDRKFFPDANSTLRVAYGQVKGSDPRDAVSYGYQTHLAGVMEKYIPGDYEFDLPKKLINLYNTKDYGVYKDKTGDVPVNFTATNHTTGGNSGSPALDAYGNLIGLNFDRQWEGTMSDINYDPKLCRNIMVDTKYILFVIDKYADSKWLLNEMKIVK
ncbi:MAG: hypothetical protein EOO18_09165, partial [Chryseobacterium sp.]